MTLRLTLARAGLRLTLARAGENFKNFTQNNFKTSSFTSYQNSINSGKPVLTIMNQSATDAHSVVVIGYYPNGDLIYYNPYTGSLNSSHSDNFNSLFSITIDGQK